ncbi:Endonuclease III protein 1 [Phytophthora cinnamomi]|uniref:Endonuclease III protein 1 n=1 Tax=Phytophthora cinnamomi TaxID=4785 RepID=UPI003559F635|nr:Endonuclease III protein 1 [Phytophthora cinnamomi]
MWASEAGLNDDDPREIQRRREAYARELDHQIALRRARQHQEQMEREELERKLAPSERSPSKWLVEGGHLDMPAASQSPWKFTQSVDLHDEQRQDRGAATGETNGVSSSHPRFRVTDESETSQRLRERAQQMQWKRMLDEQVQEKARLKEQQEEERRRGEEDAAREEMRYLREQQLRAQRRLGKFSPAMNAEFNENTTESNSPYHALPSPPEVAGNRQRNDFQQVTSSRHNFAFNSDGRDDDDNYYQRERQYGNPVAAEALLPPPAPARIQIPQGNPQTARDDSRDTFDRSTVNGIVGRQLYSQNNDTQESRQQLEQQSRIIDEYRSLLAEIRREREELRRERDDVRREKEELRVQRALLQLENEKMASLVDAQRALNEQHHADLQTQQVQQAQQLAQQQAQQQQYQAISLQHRLSPAQSVGFDVNNAPNSSAPPDHSEDVPESQPYSRLNQIRQTLGDLSIHDPPHPAVQGRRRKPPSPMSMADFSAPTPNKRMTITAMDSPRFQRLSRYRPIPAIPSHDESVLNQSLVGESVFVPLSPKSQNQDNNGPPPRTTVSPTSADRRSDTRTNPMRSSRVIKSRGFYDFEQELKSDDKLESFASGSIRDSFGSDLGSSLYGDDDGTSDGEDELFEHDDNDHSNDSHPAASSGLFQVQVLV